MGEIEEEKLKKLKEEIEYWLPLDLFVTCKDLLPNYLLFSIYHHCAIFSPEKCIGGLFFFFFFFFF